jgi:hypothetical protein
VTAPEHRPVDEPLDPPVDAVRAEPSDRAPGRRARVGLTVVAAVLVAALSTSNVLLWNGQRQLRRDLDAQRTGTAVREREVRQALRDLRSDLAQVPATPQGQERIQELIACVNRFIDTIGRWSNDVRTSFTYYFC